MAYRMNRSLYPCYGLLIHQNHYQCGPEDPNQSNLSM
ncbi:hypothetical protein EVA_09527 [gut metagenome]|uniref:Uncharacterized protein n=1 Tax=gut metagenome TaxID=749906 RepID=J9CQF2_9ZZZZ